MLSMFCKEGQLEVSDDRMLRVVKLFGGALVWQVSVPMIENMLASPGSIGAFNVTFETSQGKFFANTISKPNFLKLQSALEMNGIVQQKEASIKTKMPKHWYEDEGLHAHMEVYTDQKKMQKDMELFSRYGWLPQNQNAQTGQISGRKVIGGAMVGGILGRGGAEVGAFLGAKRGKSSFSITYVRSQG